MSVKASGAFIALAVLTIAALAATTALDHPFMVVGLVAVLLVLLHSALSRSWLVPVWLGVGGLCVLGGKHGGYGYLLVVPLVFGVAASTSDAESSAETNRGPGGKHNRHWRSIFFLTVMLLHTAATSMFAGSTWLPLLSVASLIAMGVMTYVLVQRSDPNRIARQIEAVGFGTAVLFLAYVATRLSQVGAGSWTKVFAESTWLNPNSLGAFFLLCSSIPLGRWARDGFVWSSAISTAVLAGACIATFSRSSLLGLVAIMVVTVLRRRRLILPIGAAVTYLIVWTPQALADRIAYTFQGGQLDISSNTRLLLWHAATEIGFDNPVLGVGLAQLGDKLGPLAVEKGIQFAHNSYLTLFAAFGLPMATLGLLLVLGVLRTLVRRVRVDGASPHGLAALAGFCGLAVASLFGEPLLSSGVTCVAVAVIANGVREGQRW